MRNEIKDLEGTKKKSEQAGDNQGTHKVENWTVEKA